LLLETILIIDYYFLTSTHLSFIGVIICSNSQLVYINSMSCRTQTCVQHYDPPNLRSIGASMLDMC